MESPSAVPRVESGSERTQDRNSPQKKPGLRRAFSYHSNDVSGRLLTVNRKLGTAVARTAFLGIVRIDRAVLAKALDAGDLAGVDAV